MRKPSQVSTKIIFIVVAMVFAVVLPSAAANAMSQRPNDVGAGGGQFDSSVGETLADSADGLFIESDSTSDLQGGAYVAGVTDETNPQIRVEHFSSPGAIDGGFPVVEFTADDVDGLIAGGSGTDLYVLYDVSVGPNEESQMRAYTSAGVLDTAFGTAGIASLGSPASTIAVTANNIFIGGEGSSGRDFVQALNTDGSVDTSFGSAGTVLLPADTLGVSLASNLGDLYVGAVLESSESSVGKVIDYSPQGVARSTFTTHFGSDTFVGGVALDNNGRVYAEIDTIAETGVVTTEVTRLTATGAIDTTYGAAGLAKLPSPAPYAAVGIGLQVDPAGAAYPMRVILDAESDGEQGAIVVSRIDETGLFDRSFGTNGTTALVGDRSDPFAQDPGAFQTTGGQPILLSDRSLAVAGSTTTERLGIGAITTTSGPGRFVSLRARLADTRTSGFVRAFGSAVRGPFTGTASVTVPASVPSDATGVLLDVTVMSPTTSGLVRVTSQFGAPLTTAMSFTKGVSQTVLVSSPVASNGKIDVTVGGTSGVVVDLVGYQDQHTSDPGALLHSISSARVVDTRSGSGATKGPKSGKFTVTLPSSIPVGATAIMNITATAPSASGFLQVGPHGATPVTAVSYLRGASATALAYTPMDGARKVDFVANGATNVVVDVVGYLSAASSTDVSPGGFVAVPASRIVDSRTGVGVTKGVKTGAVTVTVPTSLVPAGATAVLLNVSAVNPSAGGFVTLRAVGSPTMATILNVAKSQSETALSVTGLGSGNKISVAIDGPKSDLVVDVLGYYNAP